MPLLPLFDEPFLRAQWDAEFRTFESGPESGALLARLRAWAGREQLNERASETAFIQRFFVETWGYRLQGHDQADAAYTCRPQFELSGAGQGGGTGFADLALAHNIYGVDINPESVEIAKLALWLHTAAPGKPLCSLDANIRCGNSLVGPDFADFYRQKHTTLFEQADENERERINAFDWEAAFPDVFAHGGFDCVIGNPPYIKLQHFRRAQADVADYLVEANAPDPTELASVVNQVENPDPTDLASVVKKVGERPPSNPTSTSTGINPVGGKTRPLYASTQTGNFDMYLPFIEKGIRLLRPEGRMGYIAPNVWMVNDYGKGLRKHIHQTRALDRWLDFKSHQIFDEAITYTALQFFRAAPCDAITCAFAPDGNASAIDWQTADKIPYAELPEEDAWTLAPQAERILIDRLSASCTPLSDPKWTKQIFQGLITSADAIYHLKRVAPNRYETKDGDDVPIEDAIMHPLVSGTEAKRYLTPQTDTYLLFPHLLERGTGVSPVRSDEQAGRLFHVPKARLFTADEMRTRFPRAWAYLKQHEDALRGREKGKFDDDQWFRFGRNQNIDKQELPKLMVPRLITRLFCAMDLEGVCYLDNVDVGGILCTDAEELPYLAGILNAPVCNFVWRRTSKPFQNDYRSANKQFIAPLPIPDATPEERAEVGCRARELQDLHTRRRDTIQKLDARLNSPQTVPVRPAPKPDWLWSDVGTPATWKQSPEAPAVLAARALTAWAKARHADALQAHIDELDILLQPGVALTVENTEDELVLTIGGREALRLYDRPDTPFIAAQWRHALRDTNVTAAYDGKRLLKHLLTLRTTTDATLRARILTLDTEIATLDTTIAEREAAINALIYRLYRLTPEEIATVEAG